MVETQEVTGFLPDVLSYNDYYPYGMLLPKRHASDESYRYGFQGQEKDDKLKGKGNSLNYKYRMHDPRLGRFFARDPLAPIYAYNSPYAFSENRVVDGVELEGLEFVLPINPAAYRQGTEAVATNILGLKGDEKDEYVEREMKIMFTGARDGSLIAGAIIFDLFVTKGKMSMALATSDMFQAMNETDKAHAAIVRGDLVAAEQHYKKSAEYSQSMMFELLGGLTGYGLGKITKVVRIRRSLGVTAEMKPCGCFTSGTQVYTNDGYKNIEEIKVGDLVWAYDEKTEGLALKRVSDTFSREFTQVYKIYFEDEIIEATYEHPFFIGGKWVKAQEIKVGDSLTLYDGTTTTVDKIELVKGKFKVYNFTVEDYHTYFVSQSNVLVHNNDPCKWIAKSTRAGDVFTADTANLLEAFFPGKIKVIDKIVTKRTARGLMQTDIDINWADEVWVEIKSSASREGYGTPRQIKNQLTLAKERGMDYIYYNKERLSPQQLKNLDEWGVDPKNIIHGDNIELLAKKLNGN
ncbi:polymorphic toxin-type HINT domain-containing protein [Kordia sp.]|uniref:polymorphic toxin-type HINT domain-containing protein n=1 Tax=Kordia sp. TaxID=1965332 RepID=UPI003D6C0A5A